MKISKSKSSNIIKLEDSINYTSTMKFLIDTIGILTILRGSECKPLTNKMKVFYAASIIHYNLGITNPISNSALQIYKKYYKESVNKIAISNYIRVLSASKWISYNKEDKTILVHPMFDKIDLKNLSFSFNILVKNNESD